MPVFLVTTRADAVRLPLNPLSLADAPDEMGQIARRYRALLQTYMVKHGGQIIHETTTGVVALFKAGTPAHCALEIEQAIQAADWMPSGAGPHRIALFCSSSTEQMAGSEEDTAVILARTLLEAAPNESILLTAEVVTACQLPADARLQDLGIQLLPPLNQPAKIYALSLKMAPFPPLKAKPLLGRATELAQIDQWLHNPSCRVLSLVGPGGAGKTHLAMQATNDLRHLFAHGSHFISLVSVNLPERFWPTIADALDHLLSHESNHKDQAGQIFDYLRDKQILLVLDNLECLVNRLELLVELLNQAPHLKILATSRERLNLPAEWVLEVNGLSYPPDETIGTIGAMEVYSAVRLFVARVCEVYPTFALTEQNKPYVARICRLVEGLPLGIELAAAWVGALSCRQVAHQIEHSLDFLTTDRQSVPERHRSLRAVFEYSWRLLNEVERQALRKLAVFQAGFSREAAQQITGATLPVLAALADKSLLRRTPSIYGWATTRYEILEVLHPYVKQEFSRIPEETEGIYQAHCRYYALFLRQREDSLSGGRQKPAAEEIEVEIENIRAAWKWAITQDMVAAMDDSVGGLYLFYYRRGWFREGMELLERAAQALRTAVGETAGLENESQAAGLPNAEFVLSRVLSRLANFTYYLGFYDQAKEHLQESLSISRRYQDQNEIAFATNSLGYIAHTLGEYEEARRLLEESLQIYQAMNNLVGMADSLNNLGIVARMTGDYGQTKAYYQNSLAIYREVGDRQGIAKMLLNLALVATLSGEYTVARQSCEESLALFHNGGNQRGIVASLNNLGSLAQQLGDFAGAKQLYKRSLAIRREIGDRRGIALMLVNLGETAAALDQNEEARQYFQDGLKVALETRATPRALIALQGLGKIMAQEGDHENAAVVLAFVLHHPATIQENRQRAAYLFAELAERLPPAIVMAVEEASKGRRLEDMVDAVIGGSKRP